MEYNYRIMPKHMAIIAIAALCAFGAPGQPDKTAPTKQGNTAQRKPPIVHSVSDKEQDHSQADHPDSGSESPKGNAPIERSVRWWQKSEWWLVIIAGLTGLAIGWQAWLLRRTLGTINRQADTMDTQAREGRESAAQTFAVLKEQADNLLITANAATVSAMAADEGAKAALLQIQMMKDKERARIEIKTRGGLKADYLGEGEFWNLQAEIQIRNLGTARAFIGMGDGHLFIRQSPKDSRPEIKVGSWNHQFDESFIDPFSANTPVASRAFHFFPPEDIPLSRFAESIYTGAFSVHLFGAIEYETMGVQFSRHFAYTWMGQKNPLNWAAMFGLNGSDEPQNDTERVSLGYWMEDTDGNEEHEIKPD